MSLAEQLEAAPDERWLELQEQVLAAGDAEDRLDGLLEAVGEVFGADRTCLVLMHGDGSSSVIGGRGPERALTLREREEVSKTVIRTALCKGEVVRYDPMDNANESIAELGIVFAVAAPIRRNGDGGAAGVLSTSTSGTARRCCSTPTCSSPRPPHGSSLSSSTPFGRS